MAITKYFEYTNTSGEEFHCKFTTKEEQNKAWLKMFKYYNTDARMHPIWEFLDLENNIEHKKLYDKAKLGDLKAIKKCLNIMWDSSGLFSFYGKIVSVKG